jgi:hypothetical protein
MREPRFPHGAMHRLRATLSPDTPSSDIKVRHRAFGPLNRIAAMADLSVKEGGRRVLCTL